MDAHELDTKIINVNPFGLSTESESRFYISELGKN